MSEERSFHCRRPSNPLRCLPCFSPDDPLHRPLDVLTPTAHKWNVPSGVGLLERIYAESEIFECGGEEWKLSVHLFQVRQGGEVQSYIAATVEWVSSDESVDECLAAFKLDLRSSKNPERCVKHRCTHRFVSYPESSFTTVVPMHKVLDPQVARMPGSRLSVVFRIRDDTPTFPRTQIPTFATYDFSVLSIFAVAVRYLFHIGYLRKAVQEIEIEDNGREGAKLLSALQKVFDDMEGDLCDSIDLMNLFKAYGSQMRDLSKVFEFWEFFQYFTWRLGSYWKKIEDSPFHILFVGSYLHSFQNICAAHVREFDVLQLETMDAPGFYEALNEACTMEDGPPIKACTTPQSMQRSTRFSSFPPVLRLTLKRFKYDALQRKSLKLLHHFDFPLHLHLDYSSFHYSAVTSMNLDYELTAIVAHEGNSLRTGYYVIYVRENEKQWWKLSDSVSIMPQTQVMESCGRSACFLSYTRTTDLPWIRISHQ